VHVEASQYLAATPYLALRAPLRRLLRMPSDAEEVTVRDALTRLVTRRAPHLLPLLPLLALPVGVNIPDTDVTAAIAVAFRRDRLNDGMDELVDMVLPGPVLLIVDDAQWLDDASAMLLRHLLRRLPERPWLVLVARRPESGGLVVAAAEHVTELELGPLLPEAAAALVAAAAGDVPLAPHVRQALAERGAGNPLFLAELVEATAAGGDPDMLPDSIEATVAAAIDQVPPMERGHLRLAAVLGRQFSLDVLQRMLVQEGEHTLDASHVVARLSRFLVVEGDSVRFAQGLVRDVAYEGLSFRRRRLLHGLAGDLLVEQDPHGDELADLLSVHYAVAGRHDECWLWARLAAARARRAAAPVEAAVHLRRAVEAARHLASAPEGLSSTWEDLGDMCGLLGRHAEAREAYAAARRLCRDRRLDLVALHIKEGRLRQASVSFSAPLQWYSRGLKLLEEEPPSRAKRRMEARVLAAYGGCRLDQGKFKRGLPILERAVELASVVADQETMAYAYYLLDWAHSELGNPEAKDYARLALTLYEVMDDWEGQAKVLNNQGVTAYYAGRWQEAVALYGQYYAALLTKSPLRSHSSSRRWTG
jgi:tetratricopeptide (TPR) repeat protein